MRPHCHFPLAISTPAFAYQRLLRGPHTLTGNFLVLCQFLACHTLSSLLNPSKPLSGAYVISKYFTYEYLTSPRASVFSNLPGFDPKIIRKSFLNFSDSELIYSCKLLAMRKVCKPKHCDEDGLRKLDFIFITMTTE